MMATSRKHTGIEPKAEHALQSDAVEPVTGIEVKPEHTTPTNDAGYVMVLDDGSQVEFGSETDARAAHPRAWVRAKAEVSAERSGDGDEHD
jgi:hypothetical protein